MCEECSFDLRSASASQYSQLKPFGVIIDCVFVSVVFYALHSLVIAALWIWYRVSQLWVHLSTPHYWVLYGSVPGVELWMRRVLSPLATVSPLGEIDCAA